MRGSTRVASLGGALLLSVTALAFQHPRVITAHAAGCTDTWIGGGGDFGTGSDWSTGSVPGSSDDVCINATTTTTPQAAADAYTVGVSNNYTVHSLTLGAASGAQTLAIGQASNLQLQSASSVGTNGVVQVGTGAGSGPPATLGGGVTLTNDGLITTDSCAACGKQLMVNTVNDPSGTIDILTSMTVGGVTNSGTLKLEVVNGMTRMFLGSGPVPFTNNSDGTVVVKINTAGAWGGISGGSVSLAGTLDVITTGAPSQSSWPVIANTSRTGTFDAYNYVGASYSPVYSSSGLTLGPPSAVTPEAPVVPLLLLIAGPVALLLWNRRR